MAMYEVILFFLGELKIFFLVVFCWVEENGEAINYYTDQ